MGSVATFAVGAIGEPGDRAFYLQAGSERTTYWFLVEKGQVAAMAAQALELLEQAGVGVAEAAPGAPPLTPPMSVEFRVGAMQLAYSEEKELVDVVLASADEDVEPISFTITPVQLAAVARAGLVAVAAGRPACPRCGLAMDPSGHTCPLTNGDLRDHRV